MLFFPVSLAVYHTERFIQRGPEFCNLSKYAMKKARDLNSGVESSKISWLMLFPCLQTK